MRSSLGAPHSTERCKITKILQREQIFLAFCMLLHLNLRFWGIEELIKWQQTGI